MDCASVTSIPDAVPRRTRWRLAGETEGMDASVNALVVVDYPKE
jgi:hypothetical protein